MTSSKGQNSSFSDILDAIEQETPFQEESLSDVARAVRAFREQLRDADNLGHSHDHRDLYRLVDDLASAVRRTYPAQLCRSGCSACCESETAFFDVTGSEWEVLEAFMGREWKVDDFEALWARFEEDHRDRLWLYRLLPWIHYFEPLVELSFARRPYRCPFLAQGQCSVYPARPLVCRMYGLFAVRSRWYKRPSYYACARQSAFFREHQLTQPVHLPSVNTLAARAKKLSKGRARLLPAWLERLRRRKKSKET